MLKIITRKQITGLPKLYKTVVNPVLQLVILNTNHATNVSIYACEQI